MKELREMETNDIAVNSNIDKEDDKKSPEFEASTTTFTAKNVQVQMTRVMLLGGVKILNS